MPSLAFLALFGAIAILVLIPTRRLFLAGWSSRSLALYYASLVGLGILVAELRSPARFLIPILVVAYIAPFVTARAGFARLFGRPGAGGGQPPVVRRGEVRTLPEPELEGEPEPEPKPEPKPERESEGDGEPEPEPGPAPVDEP